MKWARITNCVHKHEKCYLLDLYLLFFRFHWIQLMYNVMKKEWWPPWWQQGWFTKNFEYEDLETKPPPPPPPTTIWKCKRKKCQIERKMEKDGMKGENVHGIRKYCWFFNIYTIWSNEVLQISHFILIKFCLIFILSIFAFDDDNRKTPK
jgi:hypothetical protein